MKPKYLFMGAGGLVFIAFILLAIDWHGTAGVTVSSTLSDNSVRFAGQAIGGLALIAICLVIAAIVVFLVAVVRAIIAAVSRNPASQP
ncbi:MAG TPA: hypothetical protein VFA89_09570 [Terriglobales bacterium]|nr:hypothetical protein [Terriglobales bacterium]